MKTAVFNKIGSFNILKGFDQQLIDPMATRKRIENILKNSQPKKELFQLNQNIAQKTREYRTAKRSHQNAIQHRRAEEALTHAVKMEALIGVIDALKAEIPELNKKYRELQSDLFSSKAVYFTPGPLETCLEDSEYIALQEAVDSLKEGENINIILTSGGTGQKYGGCEIIDKPR